MRERQKRRSRAGGRLVLVRFDSLVDVWLDDCSVADSTNIGGRVLALDDPLEQPDARQPGRLRRRRCSFAVASKRVGV